MTQVVLLLVAASGAAAAILFGRLGISEWRRFLHLESHGFRSEGEIVGESPRRIGEPPLPVVRFVDSAGDVHQFRSRYPRRSSGFIHPEKVQVAFLSEPSQSAEIISRKYARIFLLRHLAFATVLVGVSAILAVVALAGQK